MGGAVIAFSLLFCNFLNFKEVVKMNHESLNQLSSYSKNFRFTIMLLKFANNRKDIDRFELNNSDYANKLELLSESNEAGYNIYFSYNMLNVNDNKHVDFLLDDISENMLFELLYTKSIFYFLETSQKNYQVVIRFLKNYELSKDEYLNLSRYFVKKYGADKGAIGIHFFRLAGYMNRKDKYCNNNQYPVITYTSAGNILDLKNYLEKNNLKNELNKKVITIQKENLNINQYMYNKECDDYISTIYTTQARNYSNSMSELDFKVAILSKKKGFLKENIAFSIEKNSPNLQDRKAGHLKDYINRTVEKVFNS